MKVTNTTSNKISFYIEISLPPKWKTLTKGDQLYELDANDSMFIPVRIIPGELSKGNTKYMFGVFIFSEDNTQLNYTFFIANTKKIVNWILDVMPENRLYFLNNRNSVNFAVHLSNLGNEDQDICLSLKNIGKNSFLTDTSDKILKIKSNTFNLGTNTDTTFFYKMNYTMNVKNSRLIDLENYIPYSTFEEKKYSLFVNSSVPKQFENYSFSSSKRIDFIRLSNINKINPYGYRTIPLLAEINVYNFLGDHPLMNIMLSGNTILQNNARLNYYTQATLVTNYFTTQDLKNLPFYISYATDKYRIELGDVGYGKGIRGSYNIDKRNVIGAYISRSPLFGSGNVFAYGLSYLCIVSNSLSINTLYDHYTNYLRKDNTDILQTNINFRFLNKQNVSIFLGGSKNYNYFKSDSTFNKYGFLAGLNYGLSFFW